MLKVLIIDDDQTVIEEVRNALKEHIAILSFSPKSDIREEIFLELKEFCESNEFSLGLLDYKLWDHMKGDIFLPILKECMVPVIAFSAKENLNELLLLQGAIGFINKDDLYNDNGFNNLLFGQKFNKALELLL
jgi:hypothetical protein